MFKQILTGLVCFVFGFASLVNAENITFESNSKTVDGKPLMLAGVLKKPGGDGPFPAVVLLHGCAGWRGRNIEWFSKLVNWGYVALQVDSFGPRNESNICYSSNEEWVIWRMKGAQDAHDAKNYLAQLSFIDKNRIAVIGWSYGGMAAIQTIDKSTEIKNRGNPFKAAIAFYPYCYTKLENFESPLLILIGELDKVVPAALCQKQMVSETSIPEVVLKIYPGAKHQFESSLKYSELAADALEQVKSFLTKHMQ